MTPPANNRTVTGHGGYHAIAAARAHGVHTLFTLSGAHIFPLYDAAVGGREGYERAGDPRHAAEASSPRLIDVRHEQTAVFAAEATGKLTRTPGFAALTAGPGVTNGVTAMVSASFNGAPLVVIGGRSPQFRWGMGALQEYDHPALLAAATKAAWTIQEPAAIGAEVCRAFDLAGQAHRGPVFVDIPMDRFYTPAEAAEPSPKSGPERTPDADALDAATAVIQAARAPVVVLSSDVWADGAERAARDLVEEFDLPVIATGMGRGILQPGHRLLVTRARSAAFRGADVVVVVGAPLDFRLGYGVFGDPAYPASVVLLTDTPTDDGPRPEGGGPTAATAVRARVGADLRGTLVGLADRLRSRGLAAPGTWLDDLRQADAAARGRDAATLSSVADPIHPARVYGELLPRLAGDAVVIGDGGDFVSFAGRFVEPGLPGHWLDPGPFGALGTGLGYAMAARVAHPSSQVVLLLGDGAAGLSLMDVDSLVRHGLPVVMVVGNNGAWGLEKHPMRFLHGYDVLADLGPATRYDRVVTALGGAGELVSDPAGIGPALDRAFAAAVPYLVNVITDPQAAYPRSTTGL